MQPEDCHNADHDTRRRGRCAASEGHATPFHWSAGLQSAGPPERPAFRCNRSVKGQRSVPGNRIGSLRGYCHGERSGRNSASQQNKPSSWGRTAVSFLLALRGLNVKRAGAYQGQEPRTARTTNRSGIEMFHLSGGLTSNKGAKCHRGIERMQRKPTNPTPSAHK
jgi:hypothetical protein